MPPAIPVPQAAKPRAHQPLTSVARAAIRAKAAARAIEEDAELGAILEHVEKEIKRMSAKFDKSEWYYRERLYFQVCLHM